MVGKIVNPCDRCGAESQKRADLSKEKRKLFLCTEHAQAHEDALKKQNFVLTDL
jgi:uncharacterized protein YcbX